MALGRRGLELQLRPGRPGQKHVAALEPGRRAKLLHPTGVVNGRKQVLARGFVGILADPDVLILLGRRELSEDLHADAFLPLRHAVHPLREGIHAARLDGIHPDLEDTLSPRPARSAYLPQPGSTGTPRIRWQSPQTIATQATSFVHTCFTHFVARDPANSIPAEQPFKGSSNWDRIRVIMRIRTGLACIAALLTMAGVSIRAEDWPEFRGKGRLGVWNETGILEKFPEGGLNVLWRTPVRAGYSGPAVANGRVFLLDYLETQHLRGTERALALDEKTGKILWTQEWPVNYSGISWPVGPRATPTVDGDRVYVAGADGKLFCLNVSDGSIIWKKDYAVDYKADHTKWGNDWGFASSPLVDGERLICLVGGQPDAKVVAFDKMTGKEIWRALKSENDLGVAQPIIITAGGARQLIIWYPGAVASLDPVTGKMYWEQPYKVGASMTVPTPVQQGSLLFFTNFYNGP